MCPTYLEPVLASRKVGAGNVDHNLELAGRVILEEGRDRDDGGRRDQQFELVDVGDLCRLNVSERHGRTLERNRKGQISTHGFGIRALWASIACRDIAGERQQLSDDGIPFVDAGRGCLGQPSQAWYGRPGSFRSNNKGSLAKHGIAWLFMHGAG